MMLHSIREKAKGWFAWVIVILISVPFALWGVGSYITPDPNPPIVTINDSNISTYEFQSALQREQQSQTENLDESLLRNNVLERLINSKALLNHIQTTGFSTSKNMVNSQILNEKNFQDPKTGQFSETVLLQMLTRMGLSFAEFEQRIKNDLLTQQYLESLNLSSITSKNNLDKMIALLKQKREISYIIIDPKKLSEATPPTDEEISQYYEDNKHKYEVSEKIKVAYIELSRKELAKAVDIAEDDINQYYDENKSRYTTAEQRKASHILLTFDKENDEEKNKAENLAKEILAKINSGESFDELAKQHSKDPGSAINGGDLGFFGKGDMVPEFEQATYDLKLDQVSGAIESDFGFHIIKLTGINESKVKPLDDVKDKIITELQFDQAEPLYYEKNEALQTIAYEQPDNLDAASSAIDIDIKKSELFSRSGGEGIFSNKKLMNILFSEEVLDSGNNSEMVELANDHVVVARIFDKVPAFIKPLNEVSESISKVLIIKANNNNALSLANSINSVSTDASEKLITDNNLEEISTGLIERNASSVLPEIMQKAFSMPRVTGDDKQSLTFKMRDGKAVVLTLKQVSNGKNDDEAFAQMMETQLGQYSGNLLTNLAITDIRSQAKIKIFKERLSQER